jgi:hypothetical protein
MKIYILLITLNNTVIPYQYKFAFKDTCDKIGKELSNIKKNWSYSCVPKTIRKLKD